MSLVFSVVMVIPMQARQRTHRRGGARKIHSRRLGAYCRAAEHVSFTDTAAMLPKLVAAQLLHHLEHVPEGGDNFLQGVHKSV